MNDHSLRVLEYADVRRLLAEQTSTALGRELAEALEPLTDSGRIRLLLGETTEAVTLLVRVGRVPLGGIRDVRSAVKLAAREGMLEPDVLLSIADTLAAAGKLRSFLCQHREVAPTLASKSDEIGDLRPLQEAIRAAIDDHAEVRDSASATLERLRREIKVTHSRMMEKLQSILRSSGSRDLIQEPIITMRGDRYCIPVKAEYRGQFGGLVHDQSGSGATVFMEPMVAVELGNELRQLVIQERQEVERILTALTGRVGSHSVELERTLAALGTVDFIVARARLSLSQQASQPDLSEGHRLYLRQARHPLLHGSVVPIDVTLGEPDPVLVITGPNTGGKTVSLKTVGLLSLMAQSGLHVPAETGSCVPVLEGIFADIGDEQSIQQSLSTFSGHITNIAAILRQVDRCGGHCLVLLDEVGAGTDPAEGAALAKSILHYLLRRGAICIATTHYGELKEFAYTHEGVENASVEFDLETLHPTYRLLIGIPGSSNAFTVAARLGLPESLIADARSMVGTDRAELATVIERLTSDQKETEENRIRSARAAADVEALQARYERDLKQLRADREETTRRARAEADRLLRRARREADDLVDELKRLEKQARETVSSVDISRLRDEVKTASEKVAGSPEPNPQPADSDLQPSTYNTPPVPRTDTRPPEVGDLVWIASLNQRGTLLEEPADGRAPVQIGAMRMTLPYRSLQRLMGAAAAAKGEALSERGAATKLQLKARSDVASEVHLRGQHVEEALRLLDDYIDSVCLAGISPVRIVHGKGTGTLRRAVWDWLQAHPYVEDVRLGEDGEGGSGVTVVRMRE